MNIGLGLCCMGIERPISGRAFFSGTASRRGSRSIDASPERNGQDRRIRGWPSSDDCPRSTNGRGANMWELSASKAVVKDVAQLIVYRLASPEHAGAHSSDRARHC